MCKHTSSENKSEEIIWQNTLIDRYYTARMLLVFYINHIIQ